MGFAIEPDQSIERFSIVCIGSANLGSNSVHNDDDSQYAKIDKCDIYFSGTGSRLVGGIYHNANKIEFTDCLFSEQASKVGYADCTAASVGFGHRNFIGFKRCSFFFPSIPYKGQFVYDTQGHSTGQLWLGASLLLPSTCGMERKFCMRSLILVRLESCGWPLFELSC